MSNSRWQPREVDVPCEQAIVTYACKHQCFRYQDSVALQFHLEVTSPDAERWADAYAGELSAVGKTKEQVVSECREREYQMGKLAELLMSNLLETISRR